MTEETAMSEVEKILAFTPQQIRDRIAVIERVLQSWKGVPEYADTIRMQVWALGIAAGVLEQARKLVDGEARAAELTENQRQACAIAGCEQLLKRFAGG